MDSNRFDNWTKERALRLSRRDALKAMGAGGAALILPRTVAAQTPCSLTIHAETGAGPSAPAAYDGVLQFSLDVNGGFTQATFTPVGGSPLPVTGVATGRAIDFQVDLGGSQPVSFSGAGTQPFDLCQGGAGGLFSGPQPGDLGGWQTSGVTATNGSSSGQTNPQPSAPTTCAAGQTLCNGTCIANCQNGQLLDTASCTCVTPQPNCLEFQAPCDDDDQCCSGFCTNGECRSCGGIKCDDKCIDPMLDPEHCGGCNQPCSSGECNGGVCNQCSAAGGSCIDHADCCDSLCTLGICRCAALNEPCRDHFDCCLVDDTICHNPGGGNFVCRLLSGRPCAQNSDCVWSVCDNGICD